MQAPLTPPKVNDETNQATIISKNAIDSTAHSPRVEYIPTIPCKEFSPKVEHSVKLYDAQSSRPKQHEKPSFHAMQPIHRDPTRLKIVKAVSSIQLEETQLKKMTR